VTRRATSITRWLGAAVGLAVITLVGLRYGHTPALALMIVALLVVAVFGGSGREHR
jgi:hypothetical protein